MTQSISNESKVQFVTNRDSKPEKQMRTIAIIVAAGVGQRTGCVLPKQFMHFGDKMMVQWSIDYFKSDSRFDEVILVHSPNIASNIYNTLQENKGLHFVIGGDTRSESCCNGLEYANKLGADFVFIHDAARPGIDTQTIDRLFNALEAGSDGAVPAISLADALWLTNATTGNLSASIDRTKKVRVQTPQAFRLDLLVKAYSGRVLGSQIADDAEIAIDALMKIATVEGTYYLDKITYQSDFDRMKNLLCGPEVKQNRIGFGYDAHKFGSGDFVTLCGVKIPHDHGLIGHSDADVAWHALVDAILGALAEGDIGRAFPPTEAKWRGASSEIFLEFAAKRVAARGGKIANIDITIICEAPKISPNNAALVGSTARVCGIPEELVNIKATTTEQMGFTGRKEGIAAQALVNISF
jgi:2-C-methyl-D-erythritol 4-phosphate cytidylyltransferase/2-C-methyl-D-erythritol 2,4-cyclodiphosphate synthase